MTKMERLPALYNPYLIRLDFTDNMAWSQVMSEALGETVEGFRASLEVIDDISYEGADPFDVAKYIDTQFNLYCCFADSYTMTHPDHPILVMQIPLGYTMRSSTAGIQPVENNLSIANMDIEEFAAACDPDGIFRDFR